MYKTYVISLNKPDNLLSEIRNYGLDPILVEGVIGKKLSSDEIKENTSTFGSMFAPLSVIGCGMAHIKTWKLFVESGAKYGIIFEDDAVFEDNFREELDKGIKNTPDNFDILYLGCFGCENNLNYSTLQFANQGIININAKFRNNYVNKPFIALALHAYVISRKGAKKLISYIDGNIYTHIDINIQSLVSNNLINAYSYNNRIAYQTSTDKTQSLNIASSHPIIINNILSEIYVDKMVKVSYISTVSALRIGNFNIYSWSVIFILLGLILSTTDIDALTITLGYILISLPDLYIDVNNKTIKIHYLLLIITYLIFKEFKIWDMVEN
jgi:GR25 family glycosyltransferase involved in LPS biosynthesis